MAYFSSHLFLFLVFVFCFHFWASSEVFFLYIPHIHIHTPIDIFLCSNGLLQTLKYTQKMLTQPKCFLFWGRILLNVRIFTIPLAERRMKCDQINTWQKERYSLRLSCNIIGIHVHHLNTEYSHKYQLHIHIQYAILFLCTF